MYENLIKRTKKAIVFLKKEEHLTDEESEPLWPITHTSLLSKTMAGIADLMTKFAKQEVNDAKRRWDKCHIQNVSQQRELLIDFCEVYAEGQFEDPDDIEGIVDWYMKVKDN